MKIILFSRRHAAHAAGEVEQLFGAIACYGYDYAVNEEFVPAVAALTGRTVPAEKIYGSRVPLAAGEAGRPDAPSSQAVMLCYGGDGTLLEGVSRLGGAAVPVAGINSGRLGFLASAPQEGIEALFAELAAGSLAMQPRMLLSASGGFATGTEGRQLAVNEVSVQRHGAGTVAVETFIDGQPVATYHGDGVIVATPTGSTAYSLSVGGPVVAPQCACLVVAPIAPHNLSMRPVVVPDTSEIRLRIHARQAEVAVTCDNRIFAAEDGAEIRIRRAEERIFLAVPHNISFYDTLRNKMMWGIDLRS